MKKVSLFQMAAAPIAAGLLVAFMSTVSAQTVRIGMTAADIPQTTGQPDQGFEGFRFAGAQSFDPVYLERVFGFSPKEVGSLLGAAGLLSIVGYYLGGWGYAYLQVLGDAVEGAKSINDDKLAEYLHNNEFKTIMGDFRFGKDGEWTKSAMLTVQYHGVTEAANLETWRGMDYQTVLTPTDQKTGDVIYPYAKAK